MSRRFLKTFLGDPVRPLRTVVRPAAIDRGWMATDHRNWFHADLPLLWTDIREAKLPWALPSLDAANSVPVKTRGIRKAGLVVP